MPAASPARTRPTSCSRAWASGRTTCSVRSRHSPRCCSMRREVDQPMLRSVGWIVSLVGLTTLAALVVPNWTPGPVIGSGGYVGAMGRGLLEMHFAKTGAFIFTLSVLAAGLLLATDYVLLRAAVATTSVSGRSIAHIGHFGSAAAKRKSSRVKSDLEDEDEIAEALGEDDEEEDGEREIRIRTPADKAEEAAVRRRGRRRRGRRRRRRGRGRRGRSATSRTPRPPARARSLPTASRRRSASRAAARPSDREEVRARRTDRTARSGRPAGRPGNRLRDAAARLAAAERRDLLRGAREGSPPQGQDPGKDVQQLRLQRHESSRSRPARSSPSSKSSSKPACGCRRSPSLADDLAIALRVPSVRIVAPIPGKNTVGIEVPNDEAAAGPPPRSDRGDQRPSASR